MTVRSTSGTTILAVRGDDADERQEPLAGEEPLEIRACGPGQESVPIAVTMRTPGGEAELAAGFLISEGLISASDLVAVRFEAGDPARMAQPDDEITVRLVDWFDAGRVAARHFVATASCGICGKASIDDVVLRCQPLPAGPVLARSILVGLPALMRDAQAVFETTGGLHASGLFTVNVGGDIAFLNGVLKILIEDGSTDDDFIDRHTKGWPELQAELATQDLADLARWSGASVDDMRRFAGMYAAARSAVLVWSMGITQHVCGTDNVAAIIDLALARGNVGRPGAGLMPIRGHSGVQGGAEMGCYATVLPGGVPISSESAAALSQQYGFPVGAERGRSAAEMVEAAGRGELDLLWSIGGNFLDTLPDPPSVEAALANVPLRVHEDIVVSSQMLSEPGDAVLLLPATTRYEQPGGGTETTTERRVAYSPEIPGRRIGEARAEWQVLLQLAACVDQDRAARLCSFESAQAVREEIARIVPYYDGIQHLRKTGDAIQWGGERLCDGWVFPTPDGKGAFSPVRPREIELAPGRFLLSTRRGKQFNSMVWRSRDPLTGADRALFIAEPDARSIGVSDGDAVTVRSEVGQVRARVRISRMRPGNVQMFFPESNPLIAAGRRDEVALVPDYNATVEIMPVRSTVADLADDDGVTPRASGIVLAGGTARRFGRNKLVEPLDGRPLLHHAVRAVGAECAEVIVVIARGGDEVALPDDLSVPLRVVRDQLESAGPLAGLAAGLAAASEPLGLIVGGDMPALSPRVLRLMLRTLGSTDRRARDDGAQAVALDAADGAQQLPLAVDRSAAIAAAADLLASSERRLSSLLAALSVAAIPAARWRSLDPEGASLRDVDRPEDLAGVAVDSGATRSSSR